MTLRADIARLKELNAAGVLPLATEIMRLIAQIERMDGVLKTFEQWRKPTNRDWNNGAVRDEFDKLQRAAREALKHMDEEQA